MIDSQESDSIEMESLHFKIPTKLKKAVQEYLKPSGRAIQDVIRELLFDLVNGGSLMKRTMACQIDVMHCENRLDKLERNLYDLYQVMRNWYENGIVTGDDELNVEHFLRGKPEQEPEPIQCPVIRKRGRPRKLPAKIVRTANPKGRPKKEFDGGNFEPDLSALLGDIDSNLEPPTSPCPEVPPPSQQSAEPNGRIL